MGAETNSKDCLEHKVGDLVYSNSYGLGWIEKIGPYDSLGVFSSFAHGTIVYHVNFEYSDHESPPYMRHYDSRGIDTMKMFLRIKMRGGDI